MNIKPGEITDILRPWFATRRVVEFRADFDAAGLTWSEFRSVREAMAEDPDLGPDNPMFEMLNQPGLGTFPVPRHPAQFAAATTGPAQAAPILGAHTEEVLGDVARLTDTEIAHLFDAGIVQSDSYRARRTAA